MARTRTDEPTARSQQKTAGVRKTAGQLIADAVVADGIQILVTKYRSSRRSSRRRWTPSSPKFHYVSVNTEVLGWVLERTSGLPFAELISREIWQPLGAEFDAYITLDRLGAPVVCGGLCVTLRDLARFGQLHLQGGAIDSRQIIPGSWVEDTLRNGDHTAWTKGDAEVNFANGNYRNQWWITGNDHAAFCGLGIYGQRVYVDPRAQMVIAKLSTEPEPWDEKLFSNQIRAFEAIGRALAR